MTPRELWNRLAFWSRRARLASELSTEMAGHLELLARDFEREGMSPSDARAAAHRRMGNTTRQRESSRDYWGVPAVESVLQDIRYALRGLRRAPGFTTAVVVTLALGIGATTAITGGVATILFAPVPYPHGERVVAIDEVRGDGSVGRGTFGMYRALSERTRTMTSIAATAGWQPTLTGDQEPERLEGQAVTATYFRTLGVAPLMGRDFDASEDEPNGASVVIVSNALWKRRFGGDSAILGRLVTLDDASFRVIGVMPPTFENLLNSTAELWTPLQWEMGKDYSWGHQLRTIGRLRAEASVELATREMDDLGHAVIREQHPGSYDPKIRFAVVPMRADLTRSAKPTLLIISGAVLLVLIIACVNVINLMLARGAQRRGEFALRTALGAGRGRLVRQLFVETLLLSLFGGLAGFGIAEIGFRSLIPLLPPGLAQQNTTTVTGPLFVFGLAITTLVGLAIGVVPALQASNGNSQPELQHDSRRSTGGHFRTRSALVVAEVAVALVLLVASGLLVRSLEKLFSVPIGFDSSNMLTLQVQATGQRFSRKPGDPIPSPADIARFQFYADAMDAVRHVNGVTSAAMTSQLPLSGDMDQYGAEFPASSTQPARTAEIFRYSTSAGYLETMHIPLKQGRFLREDDRTRGAPVAVISQSLAREQFHGESPIGAQVRIGSQDPPFTIVGVVGDIKQASLALTQSDAVYTTTAQWHWVDRTMSIVVRTRGDARALAPTIRAAIWSVDRNQPIVRVATMAALVETTASERRFALILFEAFGLVALALAAAGIYGVLAGTVVERTREIGVRSALGATPTSIVAMVTRQGLQMTALGTVFGLAGAAAASRVIRSLLFGVSRLDPVTYLVVVLVLAVVAAVACALPAWRASRVDPIIALRSD